MIRRSVTRALAALGAIALAGSLAQSYPASAPAYAGASGGSTWRACASGASGRSASFSRAARASGVPRPVLLGVSYLESRWEDHGGSPSLAGGYGPMHLTDLATTPYADLDPGAKGDGSHLARPARIEARPLRGARFHTLHRAAHLTGLTADRLRHDPAANICAGAALLAAEHRRQGGGLSGWTDAVARYSTASDVVTAARFADQVFRVIRTGAVRRTDDGLVRLSSHRDARPSAGRLRGLGLSSRPSDGVDCPAGLGCESVPAPYEQYGPTPADYGNHDLAHRPQTPRIDFIVIHDTEGTYDTALQLVQDPTYVSWHYTVRSSDGHIAQHVPVRDVAWHAGNWWVNMHSIGIEHEGYAADGASWFTEAMYEDSADLVRYLSHTYDVPLDRAHVIGHDQVPGIDPAHVASMHWDPGPYWDWEHYFALLRHPITGRPHLAPDRARVRPDSVVTVAPGFSDNEQPVTGCDDQHPDGACPSQGTNFVYLHTQPRADSPLVGDIGLRPDGGPSTTRVDDIGARATAGQRLVVADRRSGWLGVWWLGDLAWLPDPGARPAVVPTRSQVVVARGQRDVVVYGRAYPEASAYPSQITPQEVVPLQYTLGPGQAYALADGRVPTDYYYAKSYDCASVDKDCTDVRGRDRYLWIWFGHRMALVRAADVRVSGTRP